METTLIVGCGYVGRRVSRRLRSCGAPVLATVRGWRSVRALRRLRIDAVQADLDRDHLQLQPPTGRYSVLYLAPPPSEGRNDPRIKRLLAALEVRPPRRLVYASSSAVYGDRAGAWVEECSDVHPGSDAAGRRLNAEQLAGQWCARHGASCVILRIAGIYGHGRLPLASLRAGRPVVREAEAGPGNRIHVEDLARGCIAALRHPDPERIYNVADGSPDSTTSFLRAVARELDLPMPPERGLAEALQSATPARARFLRESRRLDVSRMRRDLLPELQYPDVHSALSRRARLEKDFDD